MNTDFKALCEELANTLERAQKALRFEGGCSDATDSKRRALILRARAALAEEPVTAPAGPTDEELLKLARAELNNSPNWEEPEYDASNPFPYEAPGVAWLNFARAVLARFGHQPAPAAEGEVARLVGLFRGWADVYPDGVKLDPLWLTRAADLLERQAAQDLQPVPDCERNWDSILSPSGGYEMTEDAALRDGSQQVNGEWWAPVFGCDSLESALVRIRERLQRQAAPVPVAVSDRLPQPEDCDAEGRCWWGRPESDDWSADWTLATPEAIAEFCEFSPRVTWLPFNALPLPASEVQP